MNNIRLKAIFLIFLVSFVSFTFYTPAVKAQQQECCEKTKDGAFCIYTDRSNCDGPNHAPAFCEDTSFCKIGCCFDSDSGECFSNTAKSECDNLEGTWSDSQLCTEISQCSVGCCQLNNQAFLSTLTKCKQVVSQYSDTEPNFDLSILDEFSCLNSVRSQEQGCCVTDSSCSFTTRSQCAAQEQSPIIEIEGNSSENEITGNQIREAIGKAIGFHSGTLCSTDSFGCNAAKQHHLACYNGDVYWFDSENNPENVFLGEGGPEKRTSYNNGKILEDPGCVAKPNDPKCGNCDYIQGTLCSDKDGGPRCIDLNCKETTIFENAPDSQPNKELGESWCIYDGPVGAGQDRPGSRHFRAACVNGEEVIEPCADFREEFCTQSMSGGQQTNQFGSFFKILTQGLPALQKEDPITEIFAGPTYSEAACRENRVESCQDCNQFSTKNEIQECCNERAYRDCYFLEAGVSNEGGTCVPDVPQGSRFWSDSASSVLERRTTQTTEGQDQTVIDTNVPSVPADEVCSAANQECEVGFSKTTFSDWECTYNCGCLKEESFIAAHSICRSIGDCGAKYNFAGELTRKGFDIKAFGPKGEKAIPPQLREKFLSKVRAGLLDDKLVGEPKTGGGPKKYGWTGSGGFFSRSAIPLGIIGGTAILGGVMSSAGFLSGFAGGATLGLTYPFGILGGALRSIGPKTAGQAFQPLNQRLETIFGGNRVVDQGTNLAGQTFSRSSVPIKTVSQAALPTGSKFTFTSTSQELSSQMLEQLNSGAIKIADSTGNTLLPSNFVGPPGSGQISGLTAGQSYTITSQAPDAFLTSGLEGSLQGAATEGMQAASTTTLPSTTGSTIFGHALGILNTIALIWTIYNIIDIWGSKTVTGKVQFICKSWEPPSGGDNCDVCNQGDLQCSEYRCRSLGKGCKLINEGTENELCVNSLPNDANSPRIKADKEKMEGYTIQEDPNRGFIVITPIPPFTAVSLAIETDEPAQCKFSLDPGIEFDNKEFDFGSVLLDFDHQMDFSLPSELTETQALQLTNGGKYTLHVRCEDANENENERDYTIQFQIQPGPDLEPPRIQSTSIISGTSIRSDVESVSTDLFVSEPAACKWSTRDLEYTLMENSFSCTSSALDIEAVNTGSYRCSTPLPIENAESGTTPNVFYFRCKDRSNNANQNSFRYQLISTSSLSVNSTLPQGILRTGTGITAQVTTLGGAENGKAICGISQEDVPYTSMPAFQNTDANTHTQTFQLLNQGDYNFFVTCVDKAGNEAKSTIQFTIEADTTQPTLLAVFKDVQLGVLSITTNEPTTCQYADQQFTFGSGVPMTNQNMQTHEANLGNEKYVIICQDEFLNNATFTIFP